jgi:hypothetical protein
MALDCKVGTFTEKATTGSQGYTGVGFQPKALIIFGGALGGANTEAKLHFGAGTSSSARYAQGIYSRDAAATSVAGRDGSASLILNATASGMGDRGQADLTSLDADGFTLNYSVVSGLSRTHNYMALGGADLTDVKAGSFTAASSTGNQGVTGVGFQPDCLILFGGIGGGTTAILCVGAATSSSAQWSVSVADQNGQGTMNTRRRQRTDRIYHTMFSADTPLHEGALVSMDSDGFTINWSIARNDVVGYLALKGGQFKVSSLSQKTSTGTQGYTGVGFQPVGLMLASFCNAASASTQQHARMSLGAASSSTSRAAAWYGSSHNVADSVADSAQSATVALTMQTEGTPTENARADLESFDSDGFTLDWEVADATAREVLYLAFGSSGGGGGAKPWLYRRHTHTLGAGFTRGAL